VINFENYFPEKMRPSTIDNKNFLSGQERICLFLFYRLIIRQIDQPDQSERKAVFYLWVH